MFRHEKTVLILLSIVYVIIGCTNKYPTIQSLGVMGWFGLGQLLFCIISWLKRGNLFISPYIIFLLCLYIFSFGQSFLWAFELDFERTLVDFYGVTIPQIFDAQIQALIMLAFFHIGASYWMTKRKVDYKNKMYKPRDCTPQLKQIGWLLFIVSVVPYTTTLITKVILSATKGYGALYADEGPVGLDNLSGFIADYCIPSVICLFIAYKDNKGLRTFFVCFLLINVLAIMALGGRTNAVIILAILMVMYNYLVKRFTKKWLIASMVGGFFLLQILSAVANIRNEGLSNVGKEGLQIEDNAAVEAIAEMGGTMFCQIKTMELVPSHYPYRYGKSYIYAFTTLIPNVGFWKVHPAKKESNLGEWLTDALGLGYGTGFSMCAEAYANFGYMCFLVFFFWGWFLSSVFGKIETSTKSRDYATMAFLMILFWYFLKLPRNNFINLIRPVFFVAGPIYLYCTKLKIRRH